MKYNLIKCCRTCSKLMPCIEVDELGYSEILMCRYYGIDGIDDNQDECEFYEPIDIMEYIVK